MLDVMVFRIRRLVCELDERIFQGDDSGLPTVTHREVLTRQPDYYSRMGMPLDDLIGLREDTALRRVVLNANLPFAPRDFEHQPMLERAASSNPVIVRRILDPLTSDDPSFAAEGVEVARWFLANVRVPKGKPVNPGVHEQITDAIEAARKKHSLP